MAKAGQRMLAWTVCAYKKAGIEEGYWHRYMSKTHAPLVKEALARHGITRYSMTHNISATRSLLSQIRDGQFVNDAEYDIITQIRFPDIKCFVNFKNDPFYKEKVAPDHDRFTSPDNVFMSVGWVEDHIVDGKVVQDEESQL